MNTITIIGDVHGKIYEYKKIINNSKFTIQVGDFGFKEEHQWHLMNVDSSKHKINFGNHDDYSFLHEKHSLSNYSIDKNNNLMTIRGAFSIDRRYRIEGRDWWANEELNYNEMLEVVDIYAKEKPKIVVSHDCPQIIRQHLFGVTEKSITSNGLQTMFETHQPDIWLFGHHHRSKNVNINGTQFICLNELETYFL